MSNPEGLEKLANGMPSLSGLDSALRGKRLLSNVLGINSPPRPCAKQISDGFVHLVMKSLIEYEALRSMMTSFLKGGDLENYHRAQDHAESCVNALHRAIEYLDRLRVMGFRRSDGQPYIPKPRDLAVLRVARRKAVRDIRDLFEHIDSDILSGSIDPRSEVTVSPKWDRLQLAGKDLMYSEIADNIRLLHAFAAELSLVRITVATERPIGGAEA